MHTLRTATSILALLTFMAFCPNRAHAIWAGASTGQTYDDAHKYLRVENWVDQTIDDSFEGFTLTGSYFTLFLLGDHATGPSGLNTKYSGNQNLTLQGRDADRTLTLNGDIVHQPVNGGNLTLGSSGANSALNIDLGGATRTVYCGTSGAGRNVTLANLVSNGGLLKVGAGSLTLNGANTYAGPTTIQQGTLYLYGSILNTSSPIPVGTDGSVAATLSLAGLANGTNNRIADTTDIELRSGNQSSSLITTVGNASRDCVESAGELVLHSGRSFVYQGMDSSSTLADAFVRMNWSGVTRRNRSIAAFRNQRATADSATFSNPSIGVRRVGTGVTAGGNQIFFATAPTNIGGTNTRGTDSAIVPFFQGYDATDGGNSLRSLMTYDASTGLRALRTRTDVLGNPAEYVTTVAAANADGYDNVRTVAGETVSASKTVNSVIATSGELTIGAGVTLTVRSGVLWAANGTVAKGANSVTSVVDFGDKEGIIFHTEGSVTTISTALAGTGGLTIYGAPGLSGKNTYSGQTTVMGGRAVFGRTTQVAANANESVPDDGLVLIHPGAIFQAGFNNTAYQTQEIIGSVAGSGSISLGYVVAGTESKRSALIIGQGGSGDVGTVTLDGGTIAPGMTDEVGTLSVTLAQENGTPVIPAVLKKGTLELDITGAGVADKLVVSGSATISATGTLAIDVDTNGFTPTVGQQWTVLTASSVSDGNAGDLFDEITDNSEKIDFEASIVGGNSVVLTAISGAAPGTMILVR